MSKQKILEILKRPSDDRITARFNADFLNARQEIPPQEMARLKCLFPRPDTLNKRELFEFLVDFSFASSALEGNTYSEIDTRTLLEDNVSSPDNTDEETKMIVNHKHAFDKLLSATRLDKTLVLDVQRELADNHGVEGSHHFLDPQYCGVVRTYDNLHIGQTSYIPLVDSPGKSPTISDHLNAIVTTANAIEEPLERSIYLFTRLPYLQAFRDCNKRTSRLLGNLPLIQAGLYPISFMGFAKRDYNRSIVAFYEFGHTELFKDGFIKAYLHSAMKFQSFKPEVSMYLQSHSLSDLVSLLNDYVISGTVNDVTKAIVDSLGGEKKVHQPGSDEPAL